MKRGRPVGSPIRQRIVEILYFLGEGYGYQIHKIYQEAYGKCTREVIYYHLKKGVATGEFVESRIKKEEGEYSWGSVVEKIYYRIGNAAVPQMDEDAHAAVRMLAQSDDAGG
ncbi:MAG: hypothetical protein ACOCWQ_02280 [Nanoarchaeota archaeon]